MKVTRKVIGAFISRRAFVYEATIEVHKEKFRQSKNDPNFLVFIFNIEEPILDEEEPFYNIELWFKTPDGLELYGTDRG